MTFGLLLRRVDSANMAAKFIILLFTVFVETTLSQKLTAEVTITHGGKGVTGQMIFQELEGNETRVRGVFQGLKPGVHGVHIHDKDDLSDRCTQVGSHYDPHGEPHGVHVGDVANIVADAEGKATLDIIKTNIRLEGPHSIVGRSLGIDEEEDRYDHEDYETVACGLIDLKPVQHEPEAKHQHEHNHSH